jgi:hypothetical protein
MNWHHDSKNSKNSPNHKPGLAWLIFLAPQPPVPFEIVPGFHLISGGLERTSFKEKEVDNLFRRGILTDSPVSVCLQPGDALVFDSRLIHRVNPSIKSQTRFLHGFPSLSRELLFTQFTAKPSNVENIFLDIYSSHLASRPWWPANALDPYPMFPRSSISSLPTALTVSAILRLSLHLPRSIYSSMRRLASVLCSR